MAKTIAQINQKISRGEAVVVTAEEMISVVEEKGVSDAAQEVDVVTTGTFGPMCSSGAYFNLGHTRPKIKLGGGRVKLNDVPVYTGIAAVDFYLGSTAIPDDDPRNRDHPGDFRYGGGHVIEELASGKEIKIEAEAYGTDCYPRRRLESYLDLSSVNEAVLFNPRNAYQNYGVGINCSSQTIYTYMGILKPEMGNVNYCSAGQLSPLLNDPEYLTIGIGSRIFLGGGVGYVAWHGTQHNPSAPRGKNGVPQAPAGTLSVIGDLKGMDGQWLRGTSYIGYGTTLTVGIGIPIPVLNEEICRYTAVKDQEIYAPLIDYSHDFPQGTGKILGKVNYAELKSGKITLEGKEVSAAPLSSYPKAGEIAGILKDWISRGDFLLSEPVQAIPGSKTGYRPGSFEERLDY